MSEQRFKSTIDEETMSIMPYLVSDNEEEAFYNLQGCVNLLNEQQAKIHRDEISIKTMISNMEKLEKENEQLRIELETHKHPLWSTREAERKVNKLADSLADEVKKNGLLNEEINQLRIDNMRLKKKGGDGDMTNKRFIFVDNIFKYLDTGIKDNKSDYDSLNGESVVDLLNELVEENEQLRQRNRKLYKCALYGKTIGDEI